MAVLEKKSLFDEEVYNSFINRVNKLTPESQPQWGKMTVSQMLSHCAEIQEVATGKKELKGTTFFLKLIKGVIRKFVVNDQPYKKSMPTHPQYVQKEDKDFETEKTRLLNALKYFETHSEEDNHAPHPFLGKMTGAELGWGMYKHHSHHLDQFGV